MRFNSPWVGVQVVGARAHSGKMPHDLVEFLRGARDAVRDAVRDGNVMV